jgi:predicted O-methyltransferase YrrM
LNFNNVGATFKSCFDFDAADPVGSRHPPAPCSSAASRPKPQLWLSKQLQRASSFAPEFMNQETWTAVDRYLADLFVPSDSALDAALEASAAAGLPAINVSPNQGKLLQLLARMQGARNILEIGTLGGYSTIWLARALPAGGRLITLEFEPKHAEVARASLVRAGLAGVVELRVGRALDTLPQLAAEGRGPFDLIFIDADKENYADYFVWALKLARRGTLIIADNVVRKGAVTDAGSSDPLVQGVRRFHDLLAAEKRVSATVFQTVGTKGYDGFAIALVLA